MSATGNLIDLDDNSLLVKLDNQRPSSVPLPNDNKSCREVRSIEGFLYDSLKNPKEDQNSIVDSGSVTINGDIKSISAASIPSEIGSKREDDDNIRGPDIQYVLPDHITEVGSEVPRDLHSAARSHLESCGDARPPENVIDDVADFDSNCHVATPTITFRSKDVRDYSSGSPQKQQNPSEFEIFSEQLNKLSGTIQQKDEEILKLSQKLLELESKASKSKEKTERKSSDSSSSSDGKDSNRDTKIKKNKVKVSTKKKSSNDKEEKSQKLNENITFNNNNVNEIKETKECKTKDLSHRSDYLNIQNSEDVIIDLKQKLNDLENEVRRLHQANVDSLLSLENIKNNPPHESKAPNESVINQLLVDFSVLKEELDQLRYDHSKLSKPNVFGEEINKLKDEIVTLRNQNEQLHHYIKSSSTKSLNYISTQIPSRGIDENPSNRFKESLESPYRATCQSLQTSLPFGSGETYRARKFSESSTALIEDIAPKAWMEPVSNNYEPMYRLQSNKFELSPTGRNQYDYDQGSVDSFVTVTSSMSENRDDNWKYPLHFQNALQNDLLSTADSDTLDDLTERGDYKRKSKVGYSFTPKSAVDLTLEDLVKFARPGGKMSTGRVCFVGHLPGRREVCVGLELDEDAGKHDGMFEGVRYFQCRRNRGVFISFHKIILAYKSI